MDEKGKLAGAPKHLDLPSRMFGWLDKRTGVRAVMKKSLDEPIPGGARLAYVFGSGLLFIFLSQIITGLCLALYYVPSVETAHTSVAYITKQVAAGAFLRSLHYYGSSAMIIVLALHFLQTFLYGSFKGRRELLWISGAVLSFLVLGMGFTGYLLPWDQKAYFATDVGTNIVGEIPLVGSWLTRLLRGGDTLGTLTLSRFYVAHVFLIPALIFIFIGTHIALFRKAGAAGPMHADPTEPKLATEPFYPRQVIMDMGLALLLMVGLGVLSYFHPVGLDTIANPANSQFLPRPEWYYLPMFEWLKFWEGPMVVWAVVVLPGILAILFFLLPFLDRSLERRPWRRPIPVLAVAFVVVGMIYLGAKSRFDDSRDPAVVKQLAVQDQQETAYTAASFQPYIDSSGGAAATGAQTAPSNGDQAAAPNPPGGGTPPPSSKLSASSTAGEHVFQSRGCSSCHGQAGAGGSAPALGPLLATITDDAQLKQVIKTPNAKMKAGGMPPFAGTPKELISLVSYLRTLGGAPSGEQSNAESAAAKPGTPPQKSTASKAAGSSKGTPSKTLQSAAAGQKLQPSAPGGGTPAPPSKVAASSAAGKHVFQERGCSSCHGQAGAGGSAPALGPLVAKVSGDAELTQLIKTPNGKMKAGGMPPFPGSQQELVSLVSYLRTLGGNTSEKQSSAENADAKTGTAPKEPTVPEAAGSTKEAPAGTAQSAPEDNEAASNAPGGGGTTAASSKGVASSAAGKHVFQARSCASCHGQAGAGGSAPALAPLVATVTDDAQLTRLIKTPNAKMKAGGMPPFSGTPQELGSLVGYLRTLGTQPSGKRSNAQTSSTKAETAPKAKAATLSPLALSGQKVFQHYSCETCHGVGGLNGTAAAPGLAGTASALSASALENLLRHHNAQMQKGNMPPTNMNPQDMKSVVEYIRSMTPSSDN